VQVDPIKPTLKAPGSQRLKLKLDYISLYVAFNRNLRHYNMATANGAASLNDAALTWGTDDCTIASLGGAVFRCTCHKLGMVALAVSGGWVSGRGLHSLTTELNLRTIWDTSITLELNLSTFGTHPRVRLGSMGDEVERERAM